MASPSPKEQEQQLQEIMLGLVEASREDPSLDPVVFVRDFTSKLLELSEEAAAYLTAHGRATNKMPDDYENL